MDGGLIFAFKALGSVIGFAVGMVLGSLIAAIWLRLAAQWLRFGDIPYATAFKCALLSNFVVFVLNFSVGVNHGLIIASVSQVFSDSPSRSIHHSFAYSPIFFLYAMGFGLLVTATLFRRIIPRGESDSEITFGDSFALASFYYAISFAFLLVLGLLVYCILGGLLAAIG